MTRDTRLLDDEDSFAAGLDFVMALAAVGGSVYGSEAFLAAAAVGIDGFDAALAGPDFEGSNWSSTWRGTPWNYFRSVMIL